MTGAAAGTIIPCGRCGTRQARALLDGPAERHPVLVEACEFWTADKGHDDAAMIRRLWDEYRIKPAIHYKVDCAGRPRCGVRQPVRVPMTLDRRLFTPLARSSCRWDRVYAKRTAVERVNSRLDVSFGPAAWCPRDARLTFPRRPDPRPSPHPIRQNAHNANGSRPETVGAARPNGYYYSLP